MKLKEIEKSYNEAEFDQDKVLNLKKSGKTWCNVAELNRLKIELSEANQNF